jgi:hypothetical protein
MERDVVTRCLVLGTILLGACGKSAIAPAPTNNAAPAAAVPDLASVRLVVTVDEQPYAVLEETPGLAVGGDDDVVEAQREYGLALHPAGVVSAARRAWVGREVLGVQAPDGGAAGICRATLGDLALVTVLSGGDEPEILMDGMLVAPLVGGCTGDGVVLDGPPFELASRSDPAIEAAARQRFEALPAFAENQASAVGSFAIDGPWQDDEVVTIVDARWVSVDASGGDGAGPCFREQDLHAIWRVDGDAWQLLEPPTRKVDPSWIGDLDRDGALDRLSRFAIETWTGKEWRCLRAIGHDSEDDISQRAECD